MIKMTLTEMDIYQAALHAFSEETIGTAEPKRRNQWFDEDCNQAIEIK
jgi:hypothetical protein